LVKIRLKRMGTTKRPFYRLVVADSRSPRDGRFIEAIGYYDPLPQPAAVKIDAERVREWLRRGARPSDSARDLLVAQGILAGNPKRVRGSVGLGAAAPPEETAAAQKPVKARARSKAVAAVAEAPAAEPEALAVEPEADADETAADQKPVKAAARSKSVAAAPEAVAAETEALAAEPEAAAAEPEAVAAEPAAAEDAAEVETESVSEDE
jgi:small subunit ribosomal protein S16